MRVYEESSMMVGHIPILGRTETNKRDLRFLYERIPFVERVLNKQ